MAASRLAGVMPPDELLDASAYLEHTAAALQRLGIAADPVVRVGDAAGSIIDVARAARVHAIGMSTHGRRGLDRLAAGSVAEELLAHAGCPLIVVRPLALTPGVAVHLLEDDPAVPVGRSVLGSVREHPQRSPLAGIAR
jgi:nucleotide-binding universal stress UspA family protein